MRRTIFIILATMVAAVIVAPSASARQVSHSEAVKAIHKFDRGLTIEECTRVRSKPHGRNAWVLGGIACIVKYNGLTYYGAAEECVSILEATLTHGHPFVRVVEKPECAPAAEEENSEEYDLGPGPIGETTVEEHHP